MAELLTFDGWAAQGRKIKGGAKAEFFRRSPDGTRYRAAFTLDQTEEIESIDDVWTDLVPASEKPSNTRDKRPKLKASYEDGRMSVWCGPNKKAIAAFRRDGFKFERYEHRWVKDVAEAWYGQWLEAAHRAYNVQEDA